MNINTPTPESAETHALDEHFHGKEKDNALRNALQDYTIEEITFAFYPQDPDGLNPRTVYDGDTLLFKYTASSLWIRYGDTFEHPIHITPTDTVLACSSQPDYADTDTVEPSQMFWEELYHVYRQLKNNPTQETSVLPPDTLAAHERYAFNTYALQLFGPHTCSREALLLLAQTRYHCTDCTPEEATKLS